MMTDCEYSSDQQLVAGSRTDRSLHAVSRLTPLLNTRLSRHELYLFLFSFLPLLLLSLTVRFDRYAEFPPN